MKTLQTINLILILACFFLLGLLLKKCNPEQPEIIFQTDTVVKAIYWDYVRYDTIIQSEFVPIIYKDTVYLKDTVYIVQDVVNDYFAKVSYIDTLLNDSNGFISVSDTIYMNRLLNRSAVIKTYNTTKTIKDNKAHFYIGLGSSFNRDDINFSLNGYLQKKRNIFGIGYNTDKKIIINYAYKLNY